MNRKLPDLPKSYPAEGAHSAASGEPSPAETGNVIERSRLHAHPGDSLGRVQRIREAAYHRAEQRGFSPGAEVEDWLAAEAQFDQEGSAAGA